MSLKIGNAQGFWGDRPAAPIEMVSQMPDLDFLTLEYLAELSLSIMAAQRAADPSLGYARDLVGTIERLAPYWKQGARFRLVTNGGGLAPRECALACKEALARHGVSKKIGIVTGDDVLDRIRDAPHPLDTANAYLGAAPVAEALDRGAEIVITGRLADPSLVVGPCMHHFGWSLADLDCLAGATIAGHLLECGAQSTGGMSTHWLEVSDPAHNGYPVAEMEADGTFVLTKPPGSGGEVSLRTVKEQLLYEIGDPDYLITPDVIVSFLSLVLAQDGPDRIRVTGAKGKPAPDAYKVSCSYPDGFRCDAMLALHTHDAAAKARRLGEVILERVRSQGFQLDRTRIEVIGDGACIDRSTMLPLVEVMLRVSAAAHDRRALECFAREIAPTVGNGPAGVTGYATGRPKIRPVYGYHPLLIAKQEVAPVVEIL